MRSGRHRAAHVECKTSKYYVYRFENSVSNIISILQVVKAATKRSHRLLPNPWASSNTFHYVMRV